MGHLDHRTDGGRDGLHNVRRRHLHHERRRHCDEHAEQAEGSNSSRPLHTAHSATATHLLVRLVFEGLFLFLVSSLHLGKTHFERLGFRGSFLHRRLAGKHVGRHFRVE